MKIFGFPRRKIFWPVLIGGLAWLLMGGSSLLVSHAMPLMHPSVQSTKGMKSSSCPMKRTLPCCQQHKAAVALCSVPLCDLCFQSVPWKEGNTSPLLRVHPPVATGPPYSEPGDAIFRRNSHPPLASSLTRGSFLPAVNRPLLI